MKYTVCLICFCFSICGLYSQDTLYFRNKDVVPAKVLEVGTSLIRYLRFADGPNYSVEKKEVAYIRYANGSVDTIRVSQINTLSVAGNPAGNQSILFHNKKLYFHEHFLSDHTLKMLIEAYPFPKNKNLMIREFDEMQMHKRNQYVANGVAAAGFILPAITSVYSVEASFGSNLSDDQVATIFVGGIITGAAIRIISFAYVKINKNKRAKNASNIARLYNEMN
jgi:hypothetical protein